MSKTNSKRGTNEYNLGRNINELRQRRGLTQEKLAEKAQISQNYLAIIETGGKLPSLRVLMRIADELKTKVKDLIPF